MSKAIAKVRLAPGNVAWYDSLTNIYLSLASPEAKVYDNYDLTNIKKGIRYNYITLREGNLPSTPKKISDKKQEDIKIEIKSKETKEDKSDKKEKLLQSKGKKKTAKKSTKKETSDAIEFDKEIIKDKMVQINSIVDENTLIEDKMK